MVRATDVSLCSHDFGIKFDDAMDVFNAGGYDLPPMALATWSDETPPETPRPGSPTALPVVGEFLDPFAKTVDRNSEWDYIEFEKPSGTASSASSVMWNVENTVQDPSCKLTAASLLSSSSSASSLDLSRDPLSPASSFGMDLFATEDLSSDDDIFQIFGGKRKSGSLDSMEVKKAKARQTRDALSSEAQMRLLSSTGTDSKRLTHNVLERKRRNDLKASYQDLRENIPELSHQERAPTAQILQKAVDYIEYLKKTDQQVSAAMASLRADNERLKAQLKSA